MTRNGASALRVLVSEVRADLASAHRLVEELDDIYSLHTAPRPAETIYASALLLHHVYSALESLFERVAKSIDGELPSGPDWHRQLVARMELEIEGLRPAVIARETGDKLDEYRRFRHVVRNAYEAPLNEEKLTDLVRSARPTLEAVDRDVSSFLSYVRSLIARLES